MSQPNDLHIFRYGRAARHNGLFLVTVFEPNLTIEAFAVPAKITVGYIFHCQKLKTTQQRIIFRDHVLCPKNVDLDQLIVWLKYLRLRHKDLTPARSASPTLWLDYLIEKV